MLKSKIVKMNFYEILHVSQDAPVEIIKLAYKGLAQKYHPDRYDGSDAEDKMVKIREAYETLVDPIKREKYDRLLADELRKSNVSSTSNANFSSSESQSFRFNVSLDVPANFSLLKPLKTLWSLVQGFFLWLLSKRSIFFRLCGGIIGVVLFFAVLEAIFSNSTKEDEGIIANQQSGIEQPSGYESDAIQSPYSPLSSLALDSVDQGTPVREMTYDQPSQSTSSLMERQPTKSMYVPHNVDDSSLEAEKAALQPEQAAISPEQEAAIMALDRIELLEE